MTDRLPIYEIEQEIVAQLKQNQRLVLQAPTGSGKSTQVPQILLQHGFLENGQVVVLQPRRLAARLLAARVARERNVDLGGEVGYQVRFESVAGPTTKIRYVTEGVLLRQMLQDPQLNGIKAIILDDFHERHLYSDITLARALQLQQTTRPDLLIVVMAAALPAGLLEAYLEPTHVLTSAGRTFPVETEYLPPRAKDADEKPVWDLAAEAFVQHVKSGRTGDVLVFMPGSYEVQQTIEAISHKPEASGFVLLPLHSDLTPQEQDAALAPQDKPKVVVSTGIAETSVTIDGVRLVIDSGLARIPRYDAQRGINTFLIDKISRASADQRAQRAGRTEPGRCTRLWTSTDHWERPEHQVPEVKRVELAEVVLTLKAAGVEDLRQFRWLEAPPNEALQHAEELLTDLGALEKIEVPQAPAPTAPAPAAEAPTPAAPESATPVEATAAADAVTPAVTAAEATAVQAPPPALTKLTELGRKMLAFPVHPRYARMLLAAQENQCVYQICMIAAFTQGRELLVRSPGKDIEAERKELLGQKATSDFWILQRAWQYALQHEFRAETCRKMGIHAMAARQIGPVLDQFLKVAKNEGLSTEQGQPAADAVEKCVLLGFSDRVARRLDEGTLRCELVHGRRGNLARESAVQQSSLLTAAEVREVEAADKTLTTVLGLATTVHADWLKELFPHDIHVDSHLQFDANARRVTADEQVRFRDLVIGTRKVEPPTDAAARMLATEVTQKRLTLRNWDDAVEQWILRLNLLTKWCPELGLPPLGEADRHHLVEQICEGAVSYKEIKDREVKRVVQSWLSPDQQLILDKHAPERFTFSNGRTPKINYVPIGPPYIEIRIQELFGIKASPKIAINRVTLQVHILAPNMRPVLVTQDLVSFWREHYPKAKKELQRKFPKYEWR